jgi:nucleoside-triphosphatase THEP1
MQLGFIHARTPGSVDATLNAVVEHMKRDGRRVLGVIQEPSGEGDRHRCDMDLIEVNSGARFSISQKLGASSKGCRLNPNAIETIACHVAVELDRSKADLLVINRFGKLESIGRGFCPVIADALARGVPVLVGLNDLNRAAFELFAGGTATELPNRAGAVLTWLKTDSRCVAA